MQIFNSKEIRLVISQDFRTTIFIQEKRSCLSGKELLAFTHCLSPSLFVNRRVLFPRTTPYRDGENVIKDSGSGAIVYMPPEAKDVPDLVGESHKSRRYELADKWIELLQ